MSVQEYNAARREATEKATLLWSITEYPASARLNNLSLHDSLGRMPVRREVQLAEAWAFLASWKDDPKKIKAIALEEWVEGNGMTVRVASNTGKLDDCVEGLQRIADLKMVATRRTTSRHEMKSTMLAAIVELDRPKILSRLRSRHASQTPKTRNRPAFPRLLDVTLRSCKAQKPWSTSVDDFLQQFEDLEEQSEPAKINASLIGLLQLAAGFNVQALENCLKQYSGRDVDPSTKRYLPEGMSKLARYAKIADEFVAAARGSGRGLFEKVVVEQIQETHRPDRPTTAMHPLRPCAEVLSDIAARGSLSKKTRHGLEVDAQQKYDVARSTYPAGWKVHAEIQLLVFYEQSLSPRIHRPRAICASKQSCFLCDLFMQTHGKYYTPGTHGRLYKKWTLPQIDATDTVVLSEMLLLLQRFNLVIESQIIAHAIFSKKAGRAAPNESVLVLRDRWSSTSTILPAIAEQSGVSYRLPTKSHSAILSCLDDHSGARPENDIVDTASARTEGTPDTDDFLPHTTRSFWMDTEGLSLNVTCSRKHFISFKQAQHNNMSLGDDCSAECVTIDLLEPSKDVTYAVGSSGKLALRYQQKTVLVEIDICDGDKGGIVQPPHVKGPYREG